MQLVFATNNEHKLEEARSILSGIKVVSLSDIGLHAEIPEDGATLEENSMFKCRYVTEFILNHSELFSMLDGCFSDDTGLEIAALGGAPGVHTARWAGEKVDSAANRHKALTELQNATDRSAQFRTVVTLALFGKTASLKSAAFEGQIESEGVKTIRFEGTVQGKIAMQEYGEHGFGYDSVFIPLGYKNTFAELPSEVKNSISHRSRALEKMNELLKKSSNHFVI